MRDQAGMEIKNVLGIIVGRESSRVLGFERLARYALPENASVLLHATMMETSTSGSTNTNSIY